MRRIAKGRRNTGRLFTALQQERLLDRAKDEVARVVLYLSKAEARDQICRAIQYGSEFPSNGEAGTTQNVDKASSLASRVFRLFKIGLDGIRMLDPSTSRTLRIYPLDTVTRCEVYNSYLPLLFGPRVLYTLTHDV
ncbi:peroxisomal membrane protein 11D-like protein [Tanacetum coccineum]|uniref:Peroxisomal membrane protein 11D-like protein n=1 Tax=Tanacetum coccineum TaxID=301880 RepID=A0ABQ5GKI8_9ASTR